MKIQNDQQYWAVRQQLERFEKELNDLQGNEGNMPPDLYETYYDSLVSQIDELMAAIATYERSTV